MLHPIPWAIHLVIDIFIWAMIAYVIMGWLVSFNVVNMRNGFVAAVARFLQAVVEPVLAPIRRVVPPVGGLDLSPLVALIIAWVLQYLVVYYGSRLF